MNARRTLAAAVLAGVAMLGTSACDDPPPAASTQTTGPAPSLVTSLPIGPQVDWSKFAPDVKQRVDEAVVSGDCAAMQTELESVRGPGIAPGASLMDYLDAQMSAAGCYG